MCFLWLLSLSLDGSKLNFISDLLLLLLDRRLCLNTVQELDELPLIGAGSHMIYKVNTSKEHSSALIGSSAYPMCSLDVLPLMLKGAHCRKEDPNGKAPKVQAPELG